MNEKEMKNTNNALVDELIGEIKSAYSISPEAFACPYASNPSFRIHHRE